MIQYNAIMHDESKKTAGSQFTLLCMAKTKNKLQINMNSVGQKSVKIFRLSQLLAHEFRTIYRSTWRLPTCCLHSASSWKPFSFWRHFLDISWTV